MSISRRNFVKMGLLSASAVALSACNRMVEHKLVSQYQMPEYKLPGENIYWATTCGECIGGCGIAVRTTSGRVNKIEGIPEHPINHGRLCARGQAAIQDLYHPNRLNAVTLEGKNSTDWAAVMTELGKQAGAGNQPLFIVRRLQGTRGGLILDAARKANGRVWVLDYPDRTTERRVIKALTGRAELPAYRLENADYVVTFGGDVLNYGPSPVYHNWAYGQFRQGRNRERGSMVSVASRINMTAGCADKWIPCRPGTEGWVALAVGNMISEAGKSGAWPAWARSITPEQCCEMSGAKPELVKRLAVRLAQARRPIVIADSDAGNYINGVESQYIIHSLQKLLTGRIETIEPEWVLGTAEPARGVVVNTSEAIGHLNSGACKAVWVFDDADPVHTLPQAFKFEDALKKAPKRTAFATFANETTALCTSVIPVQMWLEEWGDNRVTGPGLDVYNIQQPAATSIWENTRSVNEILMALRTGDNISIGVVPTGAAGDPKGKFFKDLLRGDADDDRWQNLVVRGGAWKAADLDWEHYHNRVSNPPPPVADPGSPPGAANPYANLDPIQVSSWSNTVPSGASVLPYASLAWKDGTLYHRPWLAELQDPITTVMWGGWVEMSEELAMELGVERHDLLRITFAETGLALEAPAFPLPSLHRDTIAIPVGQEHPDYKKWADPDYTNFGRGNAIFGPYGYTNKGYARPGVNPLKCLQANLQKASGQPIWVGNGVKIEKVGKKQLAIAMDKRVFGLPRVILPAE